MRNLGWYDHAAARGNEFAQYRLAKLCLAGNGVPKNVERAAELLDASAKANNPYAAYALGKLCLDGTLVQKDAALGMAYMERAAMQGSSFAQFFLDRQDTLKPPSVMLAVTRLLHHLGSIFRDNSLPQSGPVQLGIDRKRFAELQEKRMALGHKPDDHVDQEDLKYTGPTMSMW